jgi:hypothetical protein
MPVNGYRITIPARTVEVSNLDDKVGRLLLMLLDHESLTRAQFFEELWDELEKAEATNVFHVTKNKLMERYAFSVGYSDSTKLYTAEPQEGVVVVEAEIGTEDEDAMFELFEEHQTLGRSEIIKTLWPELDNRSVRKLFQETVRRMCILHGVAVTRKGERYTLVQPDESGE